MRIQLLSSFTVIIILIVLFLLLGLFLYNKQKINYTPTPYEKRVIEHFKEVIFNSEYGDNAQRVIKWQSPMLLSISVGELPMLNQHDLELIKTLENAIDEINQLTAESNFRIILNNDNNNSNAIICFTAKEVMQHWYPNFFDGLEYDPLGFTKVSWNYLYALSNVKIFVEAHETIEMQKSTILEELVHAIGLLSHTEIYPESIVYEHQADEGINMRYAPIDKDVIQLLYHPKIKAGMTSKQAERTILKILKNKEVQLYSNEVNFKICY
jgi:hypothetical protein